MGIIDMILQNLSGDVVGKIASQFGANEGEIGKVLATLTPMLTQEVKTKLEDPNVDSAPILEKATDPEIQQIAENPQKVVEDESIVEKGIDILSYVTGSKERSVEIASAVAEETGFDLSYVKKLLPIIAPIVMGNLGKMLGSSGEAQTNDIKAQESSLLSFLDFDNDGSIMDDVMNIAGKFFRS